MVCGGDHLVERGHIVGHGGDTTNRKETMMSKTWRPEKDKWEEYMQQTIAYNGLKGFHAEEDLIRASVEAGADAGMKALAEYIVDHEGLLYLDEDCQEVFEKILGGENR